MKWVKVLAVFITLHVGAWVATHWYRNSNPTEVLMVVDTSFALKSQFPAMQQWIEKYENSARYESITIATDKSLLGPLESIISRESIFRAAFGRSESADLNKYKNYPADKRLILSDGSFVMQGWELVRF